MRIFNLRALLTAAILLTAPSLCLAQGSKKSGLVPSTPKETYENALAAKREGKAAVYLELLENAAKRGLPAAQVDFARICATGEGGPRDDVKAYQYYKLVADAFADIDRNHGFAPYVGQAFRMTAMYLREGIESIGLKPNEEEAARLMFQAASYLRDRIAQYELAMMYLSGQGVERNTKMALMHLRNSVRKRYAPAQAVLGDMLWRGKDVKRSPGEGLAFMVIAVDNATDEERGFVEPFLANALAEADNVSVQQANIALKAFNSTYRDKSGEPPLQIELNSQMALGSPSAGAEAGPSAKPNMPTDGFGLGSQPAR